MRIRKNAKVSSLQLLSGGSSSHVSGVDEGGGHLLLQPHVCQLNQSPWDASEDSFLALPLLQEKLIVKDRKVIGAGMTRKGGSLGNYDIATVVTGEGEPASNRRRKKKGATWNPYEFYYYTGFGPYWRRRGGNGDNGMKTSTKKVTVTAGRSGFGNGSKPGL